MIKLHVKAAPAHTWLITLFLLAAVGGCFAFYALFAPTGVASILNLLAR